MRVPAASTKTVVHSTTGIHPTPPFEQKCNNPQQKSTFDQKFSGPQQRISTFNQKRSDQQRTFTFNQKCSNPQQKDNMKIKPDAAPAIALNIPVRSDDEPKEEAVKNGKCLELEDLMLNLSVSDGKKEVEEEDKGSDEETKINDKDRDLYEETELLYDCFEKLNLKGDEKPPEQKNEKEKDKKGGELIPRGPMPSSKKPQLTVQPYTQKSVLPLSARYSLQSGGMVAEQPYIHIYQNQMSIIPQTVEEISNIGSINVPEKPKEIINPDILTEESFLLTFSNWVCKEIEKFEDSTPEFQPPCYSEPVVGNTSPHCSKDSTYGTLSPDSNVISPISDISPVSSPIYIGNEFNHETLLNEIVTSSSSSSDSNDTDPQLSNETTSSYELPTDPPCLYDLLDDSLDTFLGIKDQFVQNIPQQDKRDDFNVFNKISVLENQPQQISEHINSQLYAEMQHTNGGAAQVVNHELPHQSLNVTNNVTVNRFNFTGSNITTIAPPKYVLQNGVPPNHLQTIAMNSPTVYIPTKQSNQIPFNIPVVPTKSPQFVCRSGLVPVIEAKVHTSIPDNSGNSFNCGDSVKKTTQIISKPVALHPLARFSAFNPVRPTERQILPAGPGVYEKAMSVPGTIRLQNLMKTKEYEKEFTVQYIKVCHDLANKPELLKERLFELLTVRPRTPSWLTCMYAHIVLAVTSNSVAVLTARNSEGHSMLYLACVHHSDQPVMARYIADSLLKLKVSPDEVFDTNGNSLLHLLASLGATHVDVLAELLNVRYPMTGQRAFNVNRPNNCQMETPLHIAVTKHSMPAINCLATVRILIAHEANVTAQDKKGMTPLHYAVRGNCEPKIVTFLLQSPSSRAALNLTDSEHNSALHLAAANNTVNVLKQKALISSLIGHGANFKVQNLDGKVPLALVDIERRQEMKKIFQKK